MSHIPDQPSESSQAGADSMFRNAADIFVSFLYGAAVHLIMHHLFEQNVVSSYAAGMSLALILFIFSDWASRTRLPRLLPKSESFTILALFQKAFLEISCIFFLVSSFLSLLRAHGNAPNEHLAQSVLSGITPYNAFALFLIATWLWNMLMLRVMQQLSLVDLFLSIFTGNALDLPQLKRYLYTFERWKEKRQTELEYKHTALKDIVSASASDKSNVRSIFNLVGIEMLRARIKLFEADLAALLQLLANHVAYANLLIAVFIIVTEITERDRLLPGIYDLVMGLPTLALFLATAILLPLILGVIAGRRTSGYSLLVILLLFGFAYFSPPPINAGATSAMRGVGALVSLFMLWKVFFLAGTPRLKKVFSALGACLIFFSLILLYAALSPLQLMVVAAAQQLLANLFLQFGAAAKEDVEHLLRDSGGSLATADEPAAEQLA
jgi:hypothetical protein